ncbi:MAG: hypothetical protein ABI777_07505 [Betaproteobacteria bacterium]
MLRLIRFRSGLALATIAFLLPLQSARAAHPFLTEDPGTQGAGRSELELGFAAANGDPSINGRGTLFSSQYSFGVTETVDVIVQAFWQTQSPAGAPSVRGFNNTILDIKWQFVDDGPLALGVRGGLEFPTGDAAKGLGGGDVSAHILGIVGWKFDDVQILMNAGYARLRQPGLRPDFGFFSVALIGTDVGIVRPFIEAATFSNTDPAVTQWPAVARTGVIYSANSTLDLDVGVQTRLNRSATRLAWLAGATIRW